MIKVILILASLFLLSQVYAQEIPKALIGAWKYQLEDVEGMAIISPSHFIWVIYAKDRSSFFKSELIDSEKAKAFAATNVGGGTHQSVGDNRIKVTFTHHTRPQMEWTSFEYVYADADGDLMDYWVIQEDGSKGPLMQSKKLADWGAKRSCSGFEGVWEFEEWDGLYLQCGNYGLWTINFQNMDKVSSEEERAKAFGTFNGTVAIGRLPG